MSKTAKTATTTADQVSLADLVAAARAADQAAADAWAAVREAERRNAQLQTERARAAWQDWANGYDPDALRRAVVEARSALDRAVVSGDPAGPALVGYAAAMLRELEHHRLAAEAQAAGATLPAPIPAGEAGTCLRDHTGRILRGNPNSRHGPLADHIGTDALSLAAIAEAQLRVTDEAATVRATVEAARQSVDRAEPTGYEVTLVGARAGETFDHTAAGVRFVRGVARVPADHPHLDYWRRRPDAYRVEPLFAS